MRLTLLKAKEALRHRSPEDKLEYRINRCCERLLLNGKFAGSMHTLRIRLFYGQLTLPMQYRTVEGFKLCDHNYGLANQWYQYLPGHNTLLSVGCGLEPLRDLGDGHATIYTLPLAGELSIDYTGAADQPVTIYGTDADAMPVKLVIADKTETPTNPFVHITRVHKEQGPVSVRMIHTATDTTETLLAVMAPTTEETYYRRYILDGASTTDTGDTEAFVFAKRRHIEFTDDEDVLPFTNISALESMMDSLQYRGENDITLADRCEADAVNVLNNELGDTNADVSFPVVRFVYPGGTTPRLTSHY